MTPCQTYMSSKLGNTYTPFGDACASCLYSINSWYTCRVLSCPASPALTPADAKGEDGIEELVRRQENTVVVETPKVKAAPADDEEDEGEEADPSMSWLDKKGSVDRAKKYNQKHPSVKKAVQNEEEKEENSLGSAGSPLHPESETDTAAAINAGVNDFLENYENARIKNLGGMIRDLKKGASMRSKKGGKIRTPSKQGKSVNINRDDVKATLRAGQFFGEMALMEGGDGRRTATCLARTHCTLLAMRKESFERLMEILSGG